jgi:hypothetical protein
MIRLLVDQTGKIWRGSVVDLNERPVGQFRYCHELPSIITDWLAQQERQEERE